MYYSALLEPDLSLDWKTTPVLLTGAAGFLGRHVVQRLRSRGTPSENIIAIRSATHDLRDATVAGTLVRELMDAAHRRGTPPVIIHCAGRVGGLGANKARPADFFHDNMVMALNLAHAACHSAFVGRGGSKSGGGNSGGSASEGGNSGGGGPKPGRFVMVGSMTSYPARAPVPFVEDDLFNGYPDAASAPYGVAKLAALEMLRACHTQYGLQSSYVVPVNLYGPGDNLDPATSHFVGALVDRCVRAANERLPRLECWGAGAPTRDFLYIEDAAEGVVRAAEVMTEPTPINLGSGREHSIREVVDIIVRLARYEGEVVWDRTKPDGVGRRCVDVSRARQLLGWSAQTSLEEGLRRTVDWRMAKR
jgi:GDP-L-fucose synthase